MGSTGLGMNIVYNLVNQQLQGVIEVSSEQGVGTLIKITLPRVDMNILLFIDGKVSTLFRTGQITKIKKPI